MALTKLGGVIHYPHRFMATSQETLSTTTMNASGRQVHFIGQVFLENPSGGSKTISAAGGGMIVWRMSSAIFSNAGTQFDIGIQDLDTTIAATPARGDGVFDVSTTLIGGTDTIGAAGTKETAMETGSKTLNQGDFIAVAFSMPTRGGSDTISLTVSGMGDFNDETKVIPSVSSVSSGTWTTATNGTPHVTIVFDDGTIGWLAEALPSMSQSNSSLNTGTTPDEAGNYLKLRTKLRVVGFMLDTVQSNNSSVFEIVIYSNPLSGTPTVVASRTVDPDISGTSAGSAAILLSSPVVLTPGEYAVTIRPTSANSVTVYYYQVLAPKYMRSFGISEDDFYAVSRSDNAGAFAAWHAGTAKERRVAIQLLIDMVDVAGEAQSSIGIF